MRRFIFWAGLVVSMFGLALLSSNSANAQMGDFSDSLISCWNFDETSGTRYDAYGSNNLSDTNTVGYVSGVVGNAAHFVEVNAELLSIGDNASLTIPGDFTMTGWFYLSSESDNRAIVGKQGEYEIIYQASTDKMMFSAKDSYSVLSSETVDVNTWYFFIAWLDSATDTIYLQLNDGLPNSAPSGGDIFDDVGILPIGRSLALNDSYMDGYLDVISMWKRLLTDDEIAWLYNGGSGRSCDAIIAYEPPTATPDNTTTPLPTVIFSGHLIDPTTGDSYVIERKFSYGEIAVVVLVLAFLIVVLLFEIPKLVERWLP